MRKLKAERVDPTSGAVVCVDPDSGEEFELAVDTTLRSFVEPLPPAAITSTVEPGAMLSPREIQARIRVGATVTELAEASGVGEDKIVRFAHPVLLERSRAAELARASHPAGIDGPSLSTLGELVTECLVLRGNMPSEAVWDAWKTEGGRWTVQVSWRAGATEEFAHWRFVPGSHGGTTEPIDDLAVELTEPELARAARRSVMTVVPPVVEARPQRAVTPDGHEQVTVDADTIIDRQQQSSLELEFDDVADTEAARAPEKPATQGPRHRNGKRGHPTVPAWEDVLLGVRSTQPGE